MELINSNILNIICEFSLLKTLVELTFISKTISNKVNKNTHYKILIHEKKLLHRDEKNLLHRDEKNLYPYYINKNIIPAVKYNCYKTFVEYNKNDALKIKRINKHNDLIHGYRPIYIEEYICAYGSLKFINSLDLKRDISIKFCANNVNFGIHYLKKILNGRLLTNKERFELLEISCIMDNFAIYCYCKPSCDEMRNHVNSLLKSYSYNILKYVDNMIDLDEQHFVIALDYYDNEITENEKKCICILDFKKNFSINSDKILLCLKYLKKQNLFFETIKYNHSCFVTYGIPSLNIKKCYSKILYPIFLLMYILCIFCLVLYWSLYFIIFLMHLC